MLASVLIVNTLAIESGHIALAHHDKTQKYRKDCRRINFNLSKSVKKEALILLPSVKALIRVDRLGLIDHVILTHIL
jgi:hypothetical protein